MNRFSLKIIAIFCMLADHIGVVFLQDTFLYFPLRMIGRLAFPLFCFFIAEGAQYTHDFRRYSLRLSVCALLSEIPFDFAFYGNITLAHQNVFLTLLLGLLAIHFSQKINESGWYQLANRVLIVLLFGAFAEILHTDYGAFGVLLIYTFSLYKEKPVKSLSLSAFLIILYELLSQALLRGPGSFGANPSLSIGIFALLAIPLLAMYNKEKGPDCKLFFYLFYPVHLALFAVIL